MQDAPRKSSRSLPHGLSSTHGVEGLTGSDFLFHLYRGAELLQDNQVHDAKREIESALRLQPWEPQGQALLAQVYFRLGLYPRAIEIYEHLAEAFPEESALRVNLALCYLKTGQPERARLQLERVVTAEPGRGRAWAYLGLAFERLGDFEKARVAFERAGSRSMARRMDALLEQDEAARPPPKSLRIPPSFDMQLVREVANEAFHELEADDDVFSLALPSADDVRGPRGSWYSTEPGQEERRAEMPSEGAPQIAGEAPMLPPAAVASEPRVQAEARHLPAWLRQRSLEFPSDEETVRRAAAGLLVTAQRGFAVRLDLVRAMTSAAVEPGAAPMHRRLQDREEDALLGGPLRPLHAFAGAIRLALCACDGGVLEALQLGGESLYVREELLAGFALEVSYESGRLASGAGDSFPLVLLRGRGLVVLQVHGQVGALAVRGSGTAMVRAEALLGWSGRVVPGFLPAANAPGGGRGWIGLHGEGTVLLSGVPDVALT